MLRRVQRKGLMRRCRVGCRCRLFPKASRKMAIITPQAVPPCVRPAPVLKGSTRSQSCPSWHAVMCHLIAPSSCKRVSKKALTATRPPLTDHSFGPIGRGPGAFLKGRRNSLDTHSCACGELLFEALPAIRKKNEFHSSKSSATIPN